MSLDEVYREVIMDHYQNPRHHGHLEQPTLSVGLHNPTCGDELRLDLQVSDDGVVQDAVFEGQGCSISMAAASMFTEAVRGKSLGEANRIAESFKDLLMRRESDRSILGELEALEGVAKFPARVKCATLVMNAFEKAIRKMSEGGGSGNVQA
ncbi:MAG: SUF system NifU family Fe-S cluster assembly protein [Thermaerobacter sp.]|nr:SUF system NifU family Fe-S cluster assembly protein [Thermaerobacter sp.]